MKKLKVKKLSNIQDKSLGKIKYKDENIFFKTRFGIHTFGIKEKITVVILDNDFKVKTIKEVLPNRLFFWNIKYKNVIELNRDNTIDLKIGDKIEIY